MTRADERGSALVAVLLVAVVLAVLGGTLGREAVADLNSTAGTVQDNQALNAAEAGVDDYVAKLTEDHSYFDHFTHPAESTRRDLASGITVAGGRTWSGGLRWDYPQGRDTWRDLEDGLQYNLQIERPAAGSQTVRIEASGRWASRPNDVRTIEVVVRPASVADFQMIANRTIKYGASATTAGKIYAGQELVNGVMQRYDVSHLGTIKADVYAEGNVTRDVSRPLLDGARTYTQADIRTVIRTPINFGAFTGSLADVKRVAEAGGLVLDDTRPLPSGVRRRAWWITFVADGTMRVRTCTSTTDDVPDMNNGFVTDPRDVVNINGMAKGERPAGVAATATWAKGDPPPCEAPVTMPVPANGAIYSPQSVIVDGVVKGRVTIATNVDGFVAGSLTYRTPGEDVLGVMATHDMIIPAWAPTDKLEWQAATISITGAWKTYSTGAYDPSSTMTFTGSTATNMGGRMNQYATRKYLYDSNLLFLQPPYWPVLEDAYTILLYRELRD